MEDLKKDAMGCAAISDSLHTGLNSHRLDSNPEEFAFLNSWRSINESYAGRPGLLGDILAKYNETYYPTDRECQVAATVIQWLGSPVGRGFLRDLGYIKDGKIY